MCQKEPKKRKTRKQIRFEYVKTDMEVKPADFCTNVLRHDILLRNCSPDLGNMEYPLCVCLNMLLEESSLHLTGAAFHKPWYQRK